MAQCSARLQQQVGPQGPEEGRGGEGPGPAPARAPSRRRQRGRDRPVPLRRAQRGPRTRAGVASQANPLPRGGRERTHRSRARRTEVPRSRGSRPLVHPPSPSQHLLLGWSLASSLQPPLGGPPTPRTRVALGVAGGGHGGKGDKRGAVGPGLQLNLRSLRDAAHEEF